MNSLRALRSICYECEKNMIRNETRCPFRSISNEYCEEYELIKKDLEKLEKIKEIITLEASYVKTYSRYDRESIIKNFEKITEILNIDLQ